MKQRQYALRRDCFVTSVNEKMFGSHVRFWDVLSARASSYCTAERFQILVLLFESELDFSPEFNAETLSNNPQSTARRNIRTTDLQFSVFEYWRTKYKIC